MTRRQRPGVWYPQRPLSPWALAHVARCTTSAARRKRIAEAADVAVSDLDRWADHIIEQHGGDVSVNPDAGDGDKDAWSYVPPADLRPRGADWISTGPQALWTVYRHGRHDLTLTDAECDRALALAGTRSNAPQHIDDDALTDRLGALLRTANEAWWRYPFTRLDRLRVQSYPVGQRLPEHYDRWIGATDVGGDLLPVPERVLVSVTLLTPAKAGGELRVRVKRNGWSWHTIPLNRGDTVVMSPWLPHEVTSVRGWKTRRTLRCALDFER